jgi:hypothetical protein
VSRATDELMDELHGLVAQGILGELQAARAKRDEQGNPVPVPASLILAAMKFLKDNGVDAPVRSPRLSTLASQLKDLDFDGENARPN